MAGDDVARRGLAGREATTGAAGAMSDDVVGALGGGAVAGIGGVPVGRVIGFLIGPLTGMAIGESNGRCRGMQATWFGPQEAQCGGPFFYRGAPRGYARRSGREHDWVAYIRQERVQQ